MCARANSGACVAGPDIDVMTSAVASLRARSNVVIRHEVGGVARLVLWVGAMSAAASGCIVPTPLSQRPGMSDAQPSFVTSEITPPPNSNIQRLDHSDFEFSFAATDPDLDDSLKVHLLANSSGGTVYTFYEEIDLQSAPADSDPARRTGVSIPHDYCRVFAAVGLTSVVAILSDRPFTTPPANTDGLTAQTGWTLSCPQ